MLTSQSPPAVQTLPHEAVSALRDRLRGTIIQAGDPGYDAARTVQNGLIDRHPALIVRCSGTADVVECVTFAREHGLPLSIKAGGHNVSGAAVVDAGLVIDLSAMRGVHVDPAARTVRAQGGATWGDVDREAQLFALAVPGGVVSTTGIAGLTLHGGLGHLRRKYGLSLDNLLEVEIVTADGQVRTANATENPDLFWAVRGAGSNFGVVTSFLYQAHPVGPIVTLAGVFYPEEDASTVLPAWRDFMATAPDEVSSLALLWNVPDDEHFPPEARGKPIVVIAAVHCGPVEEGERLLRPLRELATPLLDLSGPTPYTALQSAFDPFFPKGLLCYWKSLNLDNFGDDVIGEILRHNANRPGPKSDIVIWHHGGAMGRVGAEQTAFGRRTIPYLLTFEATWTDPAQTDEQIAWARGGWADMQRFSSGGLYLNFAGFGEEKEALVRAAYAPNYDRLVALKTRYDPGNFFRMNQNIPPGSAA